MNSKSEIIQKVKECLYEKKVIIFGAGKIAEDFYLEYSDRFDFECCISNVAKEWGEKKLCGKLDIKPYSKTFFSKDTYIVVCGEYAFKTVSHQMTADGFEMFVDFNDYQIVKAVIAEKKIVLFRGSCILRDAYESLLKVPAFNEQYQGIFVQDKQASTKYENPLLKYAALICEYYIYSYRIMSTAPIYILQKDELAEGCKTISVSNQTFSGYWPQADPDITHRNPYWIHTYNSKRDRFFYHNMFLYSDLVINELIEQGESKEEIIKKISSDDFLDEKVIDRNLRRAFKSMQIADRGADVKMADYVMENYKAKRVYQNFEHMDKCVIWEYVRQILDKMGLDIGETYELEDEAPRYNHNGSDIPIYPCVIKYLGLNWINRGDKYEVVFYDKVMLLTFDEYIEKYIDYVFTSRDIIQGWLQIED